MYLHIVLLILKYYQVTGNNRETLLFLERKNSLMWMLGLIMLHDYTHIQSGVLNVYSSCSLFYKKRLSFPKTSTHALRCMLVKLDGQVRCFGIA